MNHPHSGDLFRTIREGRNFTLKEAAGDSISVQSLSRYEKDNGNIRLSDFLDILNNMAFSLQEYFRLQEAINDPITEILDSCSLLIEQHNFSKVIEQARQIPIINKEKHYRSHYEAELLRTHTQTEAVSYTLESLELLIDEDYQALEYVLNNMKEKELWNEMETRLYTQLLAALPEWRDNYFTTEYILYRAQYTLHQLEKPSIFDSDSYHIQLLLVYFTVRYLMIQDQFLEAENLLHQAKPSSSKSKLVTLVQYYTEEAFLYLRKGEPKAIQLCKKLLTFVDAYDLMNGTGFYSTFRQSFLISAKKLNNTGQPLEL